MTGAPGPSARPSRIPWPPILIAAVLAAGWALGEVWPAPWPPPADGAATLAGWLLIAGGLALLVWAATTVLASGTTVMPHHGVRALVVSGPYRFSRNPMYLSEVAMMIGLALVSQNLWYGASAAAFVALNTRLAIVPEERHLESRFGDDYRAYCARVRRWI